MSALLPECSWCLCYTTVELIGSLIKGANTSLGLLVLIKLSVLDYRELLTILLQSRNLAAKRQKGICKVALLNTLRNRRYDSEFAHKEIKAHEV